MGLKCSVIGHRFEEPGLVHEREPRGDEIISISREVVVCTRCGRQRVLAERKEITNPDPNGKITTNEGTVEETNEESDTDSKSDHDEDSKSEVDTSSETEEPSEPTPPSGPEQTNPTGFAGVDQISGGWTGFDTPDGVPEPEREIADQALPRDNGIILTDEVEGREREYGEWPEPTEKPPITDNGASPSASSIETSSDDAEILDSSGTEADSGEMSAEIVEPIADESSMEELVDDTEIPSEATDESPPVPELISCPSCPFCIIASATPFRAGDSCPECHSAYLIEGRE